MMRNNNHGDIHLKRTKVNIEKIDLLEKAVKAFPCPTGVKLSIGTINKSLQDNDLSITMKSDGGAVISYRAEIKPNLHSAAVLPASYKSQEPEFPRLLITSYVSPGVAESLKKMKIQFMDTVGNAYMEAPGIHVYVNRHSKPSWLVKERSTTLFKPSGLKIIFICLGEAVNKAYLKYPEGIAGNLKTLAKIAGVSLGSASHIRNELIAQGYLTENLKGGFKLQNRVKLLEIWVKAYGECLRPKLLIGKYRSPNSQWWQTAKLDSRSFLWGGEVAAAKLTGYLLPEIITVYAASNPNALINSMGMQPDRDGTVEIRSMFWNSEKYQHAGHVHPLLAYADLLATDDARNIETANLIYQRYISNAFK